MAGYPVRWYVLNLQGGTYGFEKGPGYSAVEATVSERFPHFVFRPRLYRRSFFSELAMIPIFREPELVFAAARRAADDVTVIGILCPLAFTQPNRMTPLALVPLSVRFKLSDHHSGTFPLTGHASGFGRTRWFLSHAAQKTRRGRVSHGLGSLPSPLLLVGGASCQRPAFSHVEG